MWDFKRKVAPAVSVGVLLGSIVATGILFYLNKTEERIQKSYYPTISTSETAFSKNSQGN